MKGRPLGRGLAALIPDSIADAAPVPTAQQVRMVPLAEIAPNPEQPRAVFDNAALADLAASIKEYGVLSPLLVRVKPGGGYILVAGERRLRASGLAGLPEVPVLIRAAESSEAQLELALVENLQREDLDPVEAARGYNRLAEEFGLTQEQIALKVSKDRATVANAMRLLRLPAEVLELVQSRLLSAGHARALLGVDDPGQQLQLARQVVEEDLSVRATEALVRGKQKPAPKPKPPDKALKRLGDELTRFFNTAVKVTPRGKKGGRISIDYGSPEELERLLALLRG